MTAAAVGHLVRAGLLVHLGGDVEFPDLRPDQLAALAPEPRAGTESVVPGEDGEGLGAACTRVVRRTAGWRNAPDTGCAGPASHRTGPDRTGAGLGPGGRVLSASARNLS